MRPFHVQSMHHFAALLTARNVKDYTEECQTNRHRTTLTDLHLCCAGVKVFFLLCFLKNGNKSAYQRKSEALQTARVSMFSMFSSLANECLKMKFKLHKHPCLIFLINISPRKSRRRCCVLHASLSIPSIK